MVISNIINYYIVRHGEKLIDPTLPEIKDPLLSVAGKKRSQALCKKLANKDIGYIFCTAFKRSKATAKPLADLLNITVKIYDPENIASLVKKLQAINDKNVLIIGHNTTIGPTCNLLVGHPPVAPEIVEENIYNPFYVVKYQYKNALKISYILSVYGAENPV